MSLYYTVKYDLQSLPFGIDTADVNGPVNITNADAPIVQFGAARCGEGYYRDKMYSNTREQYDRLGLPFIAYMVLYPGNDIQRQIRDFKSWAGSGCWGYSWDLEVRNKQSPSRISSDTKTATLAMLDAGYNVINYSSPGFINENYRSPVTGLLPDWINKPWWWIAQYTKSQKSECNTFTYPVGLLQERIRVIQTWNKMPNQYGSIYDSHYIDADRWILGFPGNKPTVEDEPTPEVSDAEKLSILWEDYITRKAS